MIERIIAASVRNRFLVFVFTLFAMRCWHLRVEQTPLDAIPDLSNHQVMHGLHRLGRAFTRSRRGRNHLSHFHGLYRCAESEICSGRIDVREIVGLRNLSGRNQHLLGPFPRHRVLNSIRASLPESATIGRNLRDRRRVGLRVCVS